MPGLIDGHAHMDREGLKGVFPSLGPVRSIRDIQDRIAELARGKRARRVDRDHADRRSAVSISTCRTSSPRSAGRPGRSSTPPRRTIRSSSARSGASGAARLPLVACANTEALRRAGITRDTVSPVASLTIEKDANGDPTGVFIEHEMQPTRGADLVSRRDRIHPRRSRPRAAGLGRPIMPSAPPACSRTTASPTR